MSCQPRNRPGLSTLFYKLFLHATQVPPPISTSGTICTSWANVNIQIHLYQGCVDSTPVSQGCLIYSCICFYLRNEHPCCIISPYSYKCDLRKKIFCQCSCNQKKLLKCYLFLINCKTIIVGHMFAKSPQSAKSAKFFIQRKTANSFLGHLADLATSANSWLELSSSVFQNF